MKDEMYISDKKIAKLVKRLSKTFTINEEEARELIYEEWDLVESLFHTYRGYVFYYDKEHIS